jgi:hypothetical protein
MTPWALGMRLEYRPHGEGDAGGATLRRQPSASMLPLRTRYFQPRRASMKGASDRWLEPPFFSPASWAPAGPCLAEPRGLAAKRADCSDDQSTLVFRSTVLLPRGLFESAASSPAYIARGREAATASSHVVLLAHDRVPSSPSIRKPLSRVPSGRSAQHSRSHAPCTEPPWRALSPASTRSAAGRFVREAAFSGGNAGCREPVPVSSLVSRRLLFVQSRLRG